MGLHANLWIEGPNLQNGRRGIVIQALLAILQILTTSQMLLLCYFNDVTHKALNISSFSSKWKENGADEQMAQITCYMSPFIFIY